MSDIEDVKRCKELIQKMRDKRVIQVRTTWNDDYGYIEALENILAEREQDKKRIQELEEYIFKAPNLDEMTAIKYANIQREAYIRGRADEQQKAEQIIQKNYISKQKIKDKIEEIKKEENLYARTNIIKILEELLQ